MPQQNAVGIVGPGYRGVPAVSVGHDSWCALQTRVEQRRNFRLHSARDNTPSFIFDDQR